MSGINQTGFTAEISRVALIERLEIAAKAYRTKHDEFKAAWVARNEESLAKQKVNAERTRPIHDAAKAAFIAERLKDDVMIPGCHSWMRPTPRKKTLKEATDGWYQEWRRLCEEDSTLCYSFEQMPYFPDGEAMWKSIFEDGRGHRHHNLQCADRCDALLKLAVDEDLINIRLDEHDIKLINMAWD
jgi:hypothetical protein